MPSTMLNILDLLENWKLVTEQNEDISKLYILYQVNIYRVKRSTISFCVIGDTFVVHPVQDGNINRNYTIESRLRSWLEPSLVQVVST